MKKRGLIGWIILGVIFFILLVVVVAGIYFYNFHVFETVRVCIGEAQDTQYPCNDVFVCREAMNMTDVDFQGAPEFMKDKFREILDESIYCETTCFVREVRGVNTETNTFEMIESCEPGETEIATEIRGKEGLAILAWMKEMTE